LKIDGYNAAMRLFLFAFTVNNDSVSTVQEKINQKIIIINYGYAHDNDNEFISSCSSKLLDWTQLDENTVKKLKCKLSGL